MDIILLEDVAKLGHIGDVVKVRDGYARNFLIPKKKALLANLKNVKELEHQKRVASKRLDKARGTAEQKLSFVEGLELSFTQKAGVTGKLFGSVTNMMIAQKLKEEHDFEVDRHHIVVEPIKATGSFKVPVKLHRDVTASLRIVVIGDVSEEEKVKHAAEEKRLAAAKAAEKEAAAEQPEAEASEAEATEE